MDTNQSRGRSPFRGDINRRSPTPSPHQYHDAITGLDPNVNHQTFTSGKFNSNPHFSTPYLDSTQPQALPQTTTTDSNFYPNNQFNPASYSENQYQGQTLDPLYANNEFMYQNNNMQTTFAHGYSLDTNFDPNQQSNINPADLSKMSSPHGPASPNLLQAESHSSPAQPQSPASIHGHYYTPDHSRHQSLDPSSAAFPQAEWQGVPFQNHRRVPSEQSDLSSNSASPYLAHQEVFESVEGGHSPYLSPQHDGANTFGIDSFTLVDQSHVSPGHSPYISPRLLPQQNQGLGVGQEVMAGQGNLGVPGPEIYTSQAEVQNMAQIHARHGSTMSDLGRADQFTTPSINIEPAPISRQPSFEPENRNIADTLSPPAKNRGRSKSDPHSSRPLSRSASPAGRSSPSPHDISDNHSARSLSPAFSASRESSPGPGSGRIDKNRRSSTSSIPSRDYILDLADPSRPNASPSQSTRVQKHPATFQCNLCPKRFTRAYNLRSHLRTHTDERPFVCTVCGKAFARQHDRKRHEGLHSGEKKFVCRGELGSGGTWGCGRRFARADALGRHFRSEAGRVCIKPLLDEEEAERQRQRMMEQQAQYQAGVLQPVQQPMMIGMDASGSGGFTLPAALLAQYPALSNIDWSAIPQGEDPGELSDVGMGRSSFDGSSGGEYYDDGDVNEGYVSGGGMTFGNTGHSGW